MAQRLNLRQQVMNELGQAIACGTLSPGDTLPGETDLSDAYDVSRTVMREAIKGLVARGLVDSRTRVGTTVCPRRRWKLLDADVLAWTLQSDRRWTMLRELTELRLVVEPLAAQWAATRAGVEERRHIETCFERLQAAVGDREAWPQADVNYHNSILGACNNELIANLVRTLHSVLPASCELTIAMVERVKGRDTALQHEVATPQALALHRVPFEAILEGDGERARDGMQAILLRVMDVIRSHLDVEESRYEPIEDPLVRDRKAARTRRSGDAESHESMNS
jgi:DNA-binding FadR family transcriptional regulator